MILIVDNTYRKLPSQIREKLFCMGIPCAVTHSDGIDMFLPAGVVIVTEKYILEDVKYMAEMHTPSPVILYDEETDLFDFVYSAYCRYCKESSEGAEHLRIKYDGNGFIFCSKRIHTTKTEKRMLKMLLSVPSWFLPEQISAYCLKDSKADKGIVSVHVCNLNKKTAAATGRAIIDCRRYSGYKICDF